MSVQQRKCCPLQASVSCVEWHIDVRYCLAGGYTMAAHVCLLLLLYMFSCTVVHVDGSIQHLSLLFLHSTHITLPFCLVKAVPTYDDGPFSEIYSFGCTRWLELMVSLNCMRAGPDTFFARVGKDAMVKTVV